MKEEIITGLDIGSTTVRIVVGQKTTTEDPNQDQFNVIGLAEVPASGVSKGVITSIEDAVSSISNALEKVERMVGMPVEHAWVGISGGHIISQESKGVIAVSKADGEIKDEDIDRAIEAARLVATPPNYEILHVIPKSFSVDGQRGIKDPVGMTGVRLEVDAQIILGLSSQIKNLTKCVYRTGLDIDDLVLSSLAASEAVLAPRQKELGVCLINIGGASSSMIVFEEGDVSHTAILPIGSEHITSDIAIGLRISVDMAEKIKLEHGAADPKTISKKDEVNLKDLGGPEDEMVTIKYISEIIEARVDEIFEKVDEELKKIGKSGMLPAGIVLTGGGSKLTGIIDHAKRKFKLPTSLGVPVGITSAVDKIHEPSLSIALGLVLWGQQLQKDRGTGLGSRFKSVDKVAKQIKKIFKSFMP